MPNSTISSRLWITCKASSKSSRAKIGASTPGAFGLRETVDLMVKAGASLMAVDGSGQSVVDAAASFDAELVHHMLTGCNLAPVDALVHAIKHGDTLAATVSGHDPKSSQPTSGVFTKITSVGLQMR